MPKKRASPRVNPLFVRAFQARVVLLRKGAGLSQGGMARALGVTVDAYKKYESKTRPSMLPHQHVRAFLEAIGGDELDCYYLFTGRRRKHRIRRTQVDEVQSEV